MTGEGPSERRSRRIDEIRRAAIPVFAAKGYRGTSMADVAAAAGVSRPALYQYFQDRGDLFRSAFDAVLQDAADAAVLALEEDGSVMERLDGYLQRAYGDGYESLSATPFGVELLEARHEFAADVAQAASERAKRGLTVFLESSSSVNAETTSEAVELLTLSPGGLKGDIPAAPLYRRRLTTLARAAASLLGRG